jgi:hypothetical protein
LECATVAKLHRAERHQKTKVERSLHWLADNASKAAQCRADRLYLEAFSKVLIAQIMKEHMAVHKLTGVALKLT